MGHSEVWRARLAKGVALLSLVLACLACGRASGASQVGQEPGGASPQAEGLIGTLGAPAQVPPSPTPLPVYAIGDDIHIGDWNLAVLGWSELPGKAGNTPRPGQRFVAVDVIFINASQAPRSLSPVLQMSLKDSLNRKYDLNLAAQAASGAGLPNGEVNPGERVRGQVGYQIPQDATGLTFVFDAAVFGRGKAVVALGDVPQALDAPSGPMPGEQMQAAYAIGDIIDTGNLQLTVHSFREVAGTTIFHPEPGDRFVAVDLTLTNISRSPLSVSSLLQMKLKDSGGRSYNLHLGAQAAAGSSPPDGELSPNESLRGEVAYQVAQDAQGLIFEFDPNLIGFGKVRVSLSP